MVLKCFSVPQVSTARAGFWWADGGWAERLHPCVMEEVLGLLQGCDTRGRGCVPGVPAGLRGAAPGAAAWGRLLSTHLVTLCCELTSKLYYFPKYFCEIQAHQFFIILDPHHQVTRLSFNSIT